MIDSCDEAEKQRLFKELSGLLARYIREEDPESFLQVYERIPPSWSLLDVETLKETARGLAEEGAGSNTGSQVPNAGLNPETPELYDMLSAPNNSPFQEKTKLESSMKVNLGELAEITDTMRDKQDKEKQNNEERTPRDVAEHVTKRKRKKKKGATTAKETDRTTNGLDPVAAMTQFSLELLQLVNKETIRAESAVEYSQWFATVLRESKVTTESTLWTSSGKCMRTSIERHPTIEDSIVDINELVALVSTDGSKYFPSMDERPLCLSAGSPVSSGENNNATTSNEDMESKQAQYAEYRKEHDEAVDLDSIGHTTTEQASCKRSRFVDPAIVYAKRRDGLASEDPIVSAAHSNPHPQSISQRAVHDTLQDIIGCGLPKDLHRMEHMGPIEAFLHRMWNSAKRTSP